ncbi:MAG: zf-HC2 domain-containing protein [Armatimonadetes bacterium]|nr:zf-HC2 domain-containing protein [Armatimonadota bacterium]
MNCDTIRPWIIEYGDGDLDADRRARVEAHLNGCADCAQLARQMAATRGLLRALPPQRTSAQFEARLAERLARTQRPVPREGWLERLAASWRVPPRALRPALALGAAAVAAVGIALHPSPPTVLPPPVPIATESALVSQCVAQHQSDVAAQPLSDPAAQNLTARLTDPATAAPTNADVEDSL